MKYASLLAAMVRRDPENQSLARLLTMARSLLDDPAQQAEPTLRARHYFRPTKNGLSCPDAAHL
jgi:uncharacterized protein HemY